MLTEANSSGNGSKGGDDSAEISRDKLVHAISNPVRVSILEFLERRVIATELELRTELDHDISSGLLEYHVGVLRDAGCVVSERTPAVSGLTHTVYRAELSGLIVDPLLEAMVPKAALEPDDFLHWRVLFLDEVGLGQLREILQLTSRQLLVVKEQSKRRLEITEKDGTRYVAGAIPFDLCVLGQGDLRKDRAERSCESP